MKREDDQQLWDLLGQAAQPQLSPFFARNVLRRIREESGRFDWVRAWLNWRRLVPATGLAVAIIAGVIATHHQPAPQPVLESEPDVIAKIDPQDYEVVADLDELLASDENSLWDDNQTL
jgi:hypothetical protein